VADPSVQPLIDEYDRVTNEINALWWRRIDCGSPKGPPRSDYERDLIRRARIDQLERRQAELKDQIDKVQFLGLVG